MKSAVGCFFLAGRLLGAGLVMHRLYGKVASSYAWGGTVVQGLVMHGGAAFGGSITSPPADPLAPHPGA